MKNGKRDYKTEYAKYQGKPSQIKKRAERNKARSMMAKQGKVHKGDGLDVDHIKALSKGGLNKLVNLQAVKKSTNRSFSSTPSGKMKSQVSKRGT